MFFNSLDFSIIAIYCVGIIAIATYVSRQQSGSERSPEDYFLAGRSLPWWAIGASLIAANISAEQIIGCLLYTSPSPRDTDLSRMPSSA